MIIVYTEYVIKVMDCVFCIFKIIFFFSVVSCKAHLDFFRDVRMSTKSFLHFRSVIKCTYKSYDNTALVEYFRFTGFFRLSFFVIRLIACHHTAEIDLYDFWQDRATLEVELATEAEAFTLPPFVTVLRDVTADKRYKNVSLAAELPREP